MHVLFYLIEHSSSSEKLQATQEMSKDQVSFLNHILDDLDELGDIMTEMLQTQESIEVCSFPCSLAMLTHRLSDSMRRGT
jgi:hypothetical protein